MENILTILRRPSVEDVLARHPDLGMDGFKTPKNDLIYEDWPSFSEMRQVLLSEWAIGQAGRACIFLRTVIQVCPERITNIDSGKLTNLLKERSAPHGRHTVNLEGAVIVAAIICGLEVVRKENSYCATISFIPQSQDADKKGSTSI